MTSLLRLMGVSLPAVGLVAGAIIFSSAIPSLLHDGAYGHLAVNAGLAIGLISALEKRLNQMMRLLRCAVYLLVIGLIIWSFQVVYRFVEAVS